MTQMLVVIISDPVGRKVSLPFPVAIQKCRRLVHFNCQINKKANDMSPWEVLELEWEMKYIIDMAISKFV